MPGLSSVCPPCPVQTIAQPTFLLPGPLTRQTIQASYHDQLRSTYFLTSSPPIVFCLIPLTPPFCSAPFPL